MKIRREPNPKLKTARVFCCTPRLWRLSTTEELDMIPPLNGRPGEPHSVRGIHTINITRSNMLHRGLGTINYSDYRILGLEPNCSGTWTYRIP